MKRLIPVFLCLVLILGVFAVRAEAGDPQPFFIHFVVLPVASDDDPRVLEFKKMALALAGGFTELGATSGGSMHKDGVHQEDNISFIVGAEKGRHQGPEDADEIVVRRQRCVHYVLARQGHVLAVAARCRAGLRPGPNGRILFIGCFPFKAREGVIHHVRYQPFGPVRHGRRPAGLCRQHRQREHRRLQGLCGCSSSPASRGRESVWVPSVNLTAPRPVRGRGGGFQHRHRHRDGGHDAHPARFLRLTWPPSAPPRR